MCIRHRSVNADGTAKYDGEPDADMMSWFNRINDYQPDEPEFALLDEVCGTLAYDECYAYTPALTAAEGPRRRCLAGLDARPPAPAGQPSTAADATLSAGSGMFDPDGELIYRLESYRPNEQPPIPTRRAAPIRRSLPIS